MKPSEYKQMMDYLTRPKPVRKEGRADTKPCSCTNTIKTINRFRKFIEENPDEFVELEETN